MKLDFDENCFLKKLFFWMKVVLMSLYFTVSAPHLHGSPWMLAVLRSTSLWDSMDAVRSVPLKPTSLIRTDITLPFTTYPEQTKTVLS